MTQQIQRAIPVRALYTEQHVSVEFKSQIIRWSWIFYSACVLYQIFFYPNLTNLIMVASVALAWTIFIKVFLRPSTLMNYPISVFMVFAFTSTQFYLPLLFTTLEGKALIYNLELPEEVFLHSTLGLVALTVAHATYRFLSRVSTRRPFPLLEKAGFFTPPTHIQLFSMGIVGIVAQYYVYFMSPDIGWEVTGSASDKLVQGLIPFSYAPFFIPFGKMYGNNERIKPKLVPFLLIFTIALFAISMGRNSRGAFMFGFASIGFAYFLGLLLGVFKSRIFTWKNLIIAGISFWLLIGPIADLGTAMVNVRGVREEVTATELLSLTLDAYQDKDAIARRRLDDTSEGVEADWDERYLDNIFTARFANIKFNDMNLVQYNKLGKHDPDMFDHSMDYILCALPEPVLLAFNAQADKEWVYSMSLGDYMYLIAGGQGYIEGFRTGHFAGTGMAAFGWWYLLILGIGVIPIYYLFDIFLKKRQSADGEVQSEDHRIQFSFCGILALTYIFQFLIFESVVALPIFIIRGWIQMVLLYFLMFQFTRILSGLPKLMLKLRL